MVNFVKDADLPGIFRYLMEDKDENGLGYDRVRATDVAAETVLAEYRRRNPDLMAARAEKLGVPEYTLEQQLAEFYDEGYSSEQVIGFGMGLDPRHPLPLAAEYFGRGAVESAVPAATSMVGTRAALAATKLPFVPARYKPLAAGVGFIGGTLAGALADLKTGASEKVNTTIFGEAEPLLPSDQITADAFSMMGGFTTFSGVMRNQLKKIPGGIHPIGERGILPWLRRRFGRKGAAPLGEVAAPASGVNFGANTIVNNVGKAPFRERALRFAERTAEAAGTRARFPGRYWGTEAPLIMGAGAAAGAAELVDPGDPLTEFGFVAVSSLLPTALVARIGTGVAREFGKTAIHPIRTYENLISGAGEKGAGVASKQVNAIYGSYLTRLEAPGRARLEEGATALARLRESQVGVSSEQLLPQLVAELTPKLTRGGVLAGEGAGFTPEQIQAAAENLIENRGYLPEIWSPDVDWSSQGTRQAEAAFLRAVSETDPDAHILSPVTTPGFDNVDMIIPQVAALAKRTKGGDTPSVQLLERSVWQYTRNNFEAFRNALSATRNEGLDPSFLQAFAAGQEQANYQALVSLVDDALSRNTKALERIMEDGGTQLTPEKMSEIILTRWNNWSRQARDVEKMAWRSLNLNGELMLPKTLSTLDDLTVSGILSGHLEPGALTEILDGLQLAGGVIGRPTSRLVRLKENARTRLANIKDTDEGLNFETAETLLRAVDGSIKAAGLQRLFPTGDAVSLLFRPDDAGQIAQLAESWKEIAAQLPPPLPKKPQVQTARRVLHGRVHPDFDEMTELLSALGHERLPPVYKAAGAMKNSPLAIRSFDDIQELFLESGDLGQIDRAVPNYSQVMNLLERNDALVTDPNYSAYQEYLKLDDDYSEALARLSSDLLVGDLDNLPVLDENSLLVKFSPSDKTPVQLANRFRTSAPIGEEEAGSIPEAVGYGTALDLRSTMLSRLREPNVPRPERRLLNELQVAVLEDLKAAGLATGNEQLTLLTSYSKALNEVIVRSLAGRAADSVKQGEEGLLLENLLRGTGTKKGLSLQSLIDSGRFLDENTEELLSIAAASDDPEVNAMVAYLDEILPQNRKDLDTVQNAVKSYLRNMLVTNVIEEVPISSRMPSDVNRLLPEMVSGTEFFINPKKLETFQKQYGAAIAKSPFLANLLADLQNAEAANNLIQAVKNNRGLVAQRAQEAQELATVLGVENGVRLVDQNMGSDTPIKDLSDSIAVLNRMKDSSVMVPSADGTMVPAGTLYEDAVKGFEYSIWQWILSQATENSKREPQLVLDASGKAITQVLPVIDAVKLLDLWVNTSKVIPDGKWTEGQSLLQVLVDKGIFTPKQSAAIRDTFERVAEVQNRMTVFTDPTILAMARRGQEGKTGQAFRDFVTRLFGSTVGATAARGASSLPGVSAQSLVVAGAGSRIAQNVFNDMPRTLLAEFFSEIYQPGNLEMFAEFLAREPGPQAGAAEELRSFMLKHGLISSPFYLIGLQNYLREEYVEPTGRGTLIPGVREPIPPATPEEFVGAPPPQPTAQMQPPPQPTAQMQPPPQPSPASPAMRSQYAAAFPFDAASDIIRQQQARPPEPAQQGIGSLV